MRRRVFSTKNTFIKTGLLLGLLMLFLAACGSGTDTEPVPTSVPSDTSSTYQSSVGNITANGVLLPADQVALSFGVGGNIESVEVEVGQSVQTGQTLASLDAADLQRSVTQAELALEKAQTQLTQLQTQATPVPEHVLAATAAISSAQAALTQAHAQTEQSGNQDIVDRWELDHAEQALQDAQNEYNKVLDDPRTHTWAPDSPQARYLEDVRDNYNVVLAQYRMRAADHAYTVAIANAEAALAQAESTLYNVQHPVMSEALTLAQLDVERAQQTLEIAQADLARTVLSASFDGVASAVPVSVGEWAGPGTMIVELLDVSRWRIETKNVGELQIANVRVGQEVIVRINAFREETLQGRVATISPVAVVQQGDTTYTLMIELEPTDLNLRPGMTAQVEIVVE
ncbi:MAG: HlyD family efflux transporter periplasmic adaptor subunit [Chloroflexi bacterium]|nr:HlyD family efflux transporter periplasmic adaptor subunit [Chloroflexota bacterium]